MSYHYCINDNALFDTSKQNYRKTLNDIHEPQLKYVFLFNYPLMKKALTTCMSYDELTAFAVLKLKKKFQAEITINEIKILYICQKNLNINNHCILDDSLKNIVNHQIQIHNASVSCKTCHKHLKTVCNIQRHVKVFTETDRNNWEVYKHFFLSLYDQNEKKLYKNHNSITETVFDECYSLQEFQHKFLNTECTNSKCKYNCRYDQNVENAANNNNRIVDASNKNIQQLKSELQQALSLANQQITEEIDEHATEVLNNILANRRGTYDLNFNNFSSSDSILETSFSLNSNPVLETTSMSSVYEYGDDEYPTSYGYFSDSENNMSSHLSNNYLESSETLHYYMTNQVTILEDAEFEAHYANSETSTITVFEGYHLSNSIETPDEWDSYVEEIFYDYIFL